MESEGKAECARVTHEYGSAAAFSALCAVYSDFQAAISHDPHSTSPVVSVMCEQ